MLPLATWFFEKRVKLPMDILKGYLDPFEAFFPVLLLDLILFRIIFMLKPIITRTGQRWEWAA